MLQAVAKHSFRLRHGYGYPKSPLTPISVCYNSLQGFPRDSWKFSNSFSGAERLPLFLFPAPLAMLLVAENMFFEINRLQNANFVSPLL
jgi:hypothetical protein